MNFCSQARYVGIAFGENSIAELVSKITCNGWIAVRLSTRYFFYYCRLSLQTRLQISTLQHTVFEITSVW